MTRRLLLTLSCSALAVCLALPAVAADVPDGFSEVVVFATNSAELKNNDVRVESGHVVVNDDGSRAEDLVVGAYDTIAGSFAVGLKGSAVTSKTVGSSLRLKDSAEVGGDAYYNSVQIDDGAVILGSQITPVSLPFFAMLPDFRTGAPGTLDIDVPDGGADTLAAGDYGDVAVGKNATLTFSGGVYNLRSLDAGNWPTLYFEGPSEVRIAEDFAVGKEAEIGSAPGAGVPASRIVFYVAGSGGKTAEISQDSVVAANFYVPDGEIYVQQDSTVTGALAGKDVVISNGVVLNLGSFFNEAPEPQDDSASTLEGGTVAVLDGGAVSVLANDDDPNADDTLTVTTPQVSGPSHGLLVLNADGTFSYTHDGSENFADAFVYEVCDDGNPVLCATATVALSITPVNDPPTLDPIADPGAILEDAGEQIVGLSGIAQGGDAPGFDNETLPPQFPLVVTATSDNPALIPDPTVTYTSPDTTGSLSYTPVADQSGTAVITVTVMDQGGTDNGGVDTTQITFTVEVTPVNDPPVIDDQSLLTDTQSLIIIDLSGTDIEGDNLTYSLISPFSNSDIGFLSDFEAGPPELPVNEARVTFFPSGDGSTGTGNFVYEVCDDGTPPGPECDQATVTIEVVDFNPVPMADSQGLDSTMNPQPITLTASDSPANGLDFSLVSGPLNGTLSGLPQDDVPQVAGVASVAVSYGAFVPGEPDSFVFQVCDNDVPEKCALGVVTINSDEPLNNPPVAEDQSISTNGTADPVPVTLTAVDPDAGDTLTFTLVSCPACGPDAGVVTGTPPSVTYTPNTSNDVEDLFTFEVCDDGTPIECDTGTVIVNGPDETGNDPPTPQADAIRVAPGGTATTLFPSGTSVLGNDTDPNGDGLTVTTPAVSGPDHAAAFTLNADGTFSYTHNDDGSMSDQFVYEACDDGFPSLCATATVFITIQPATMQVTIVVSGFGSVSSEPSGIDCGSTCSAVFDTATDLPIDLLAIAESGYYFSSWSGPADCSDGTLVVAADVSCTATFLELPPPGNPFDVSVTLEGTGGGLVTSSPAGIDCPPVCGETFTFGTRVVLSAVANSDSSFEGFGGDADCLDAALDGTGNADCTATFDLLPEVQRTLTLVFEGLGSGEIAGVSPPQNGSTVLFCDADCSTLFGDGESVLISARALPGSSFGGFSGNCGTVVGNRATILMGADATCTVTFNQDPQ